MSRQLGLDCICCRPTSRPAHTEYSLEYHPALIRTITGVDAGVGGISKHAADYNFLPPGAVRKFYDA